MLHTLSSGYGNSMNSRQGRRGTPRLCILDIRKTQFVELSTLNSSWMKDELDIIHFGVFYAVVLPMIAGIFVISRYALY